MQGGKLIPERLLDDLGGLVFLSQCRYDVNLIGLLQQTITWYKIRHAGGQAHY